MICESLQPINELFHYLWNGGRPLLLESYAWTCMVLGLSLAEAFSWDRKYFSQLQSVVARGGGSVHHGPNPCGWTLMEQHTQTEADATLKANSINQKSHIFFLLEAWTRLPCKTLSWSHLEKPYAFLFLFSQNRHNGAGNIILPQNRAFLHIEQQKHIIHCPLAWILISYIENCWLLLTRPQLGAPGTTRVLTLFLRQPIQLSSTTTIWSFHLFFWFFQHRPFGRN